LYYYPPISSRAARIVDLGKSNEKEPRISRMARIETKDGGMWPIRVIREIRGIFLSFGCGRTPRWLAATRKRLLKIVQERWNVLYKNESAGRDCFCTTRFQQSLEGARGTARRALPCGHS